MPRMTLRGYARHRGVAIRTIQYAIERGRIKRGRDGLIDSAVADRQWKLRTDLSRSAAGKKGQRERWKPEQKPRESDEVADAFMRAKAARESFTARIKELEFLRLSEAMIPIAEHKAAAAEAGRRVKLLLQNMGDRIGPLVAGRDVPDAIRIINDEAARILAELAAPSKNGNEHRDP